MEATLTRSAFLRSCLATPGLALAMAARAARAAEGGAELVAGPRFTDLFRNGEGGYHTYRIPALIATPSGALLAFCEGRRDGSGDSGKIDVLLRRSADGGETWEAPRVVAADGPHTVGNPCPVVDRDTGTLWLPLTRNLGHDTERRILDGGSEGTREVWITHSRDDGHTWADPVDVTGAAKAPDWTWYATGPGVGIQLRSGRLLIPCDHAVAVTRRFRSHVLYSDDHGESWRRGGVVGDDTNECQAVERDDGSVLINMRSYHGRNRRAVAVSRDGGETWGPVSLDPALVEPVCQAAFLAVPREEGGPRRLLFSNPASTRRERLTVRVSDDGGVTWPRARRLHAGPAAYSGLALLPGGGVACLFECGERGPYERLRLARFPMEWLLSGRDA